MSDRARYPAGQQSKDSPQRTAGSGSSTSREQRTAHEPAAGPTASLLAAGQVGRGSPFAGQVPLTPANSCSQLFEAEAFIQTGGPVGTHVVEDPWRKLPRGSIVENQRKVQSAAETLRRLATGTPLPPRFRHMRSEEVKAVILREKQRAENEIRKFMIKLDANPGSSGRQVLGLPPLIDDPRAEEIREGRSRQRESRRSAAASEDSGLGGAGSTGPGPSRFMPTPEKRLEQRGEPKV